MALVYRWPLRSVPYDLSDEAVHVWCTDLDQAGDVVSRYRDLLSREELDRAERFHSMPDAARYIVAHGVLRELIGWYTHLAPERVEFQANDHDKPLLARSHDNPTIRFNMSHSDSAAVYAIAAAFDVGIDIEHLRLVAGADEIVRQYFSDVERAIWAGVPQEDKHTAFLRCWTRKEAYLKALGDGLDLDLSSFGVAFGVRQAPDVLYIESNRDNPAAWMLVDLAPANDYVAALAVRNRSLKVSCSTWAGKP